MKQSESIANLAAALVKAQEHISPITKDRTNPHFKVNYATLDAIMETVRPVLYGQGLAIVQGGAGPVSNNDGNIVGVSVETILLHTSGEFLSSVLVLPIEKASAQAVGSAVTYGRRYGVASVLALTTEEDDDGHVATASTLNTAPRAAAAPRPAAATPAAAPPAAAGADPLCPKCEGKMWDNRIGKKNPKAPDYKCRDKSCDGVIWPPKDGARAEVEDDAQRGGDEEFIPF